MVLRNSISNTKKFFHMALQRFKSLLSGGYERLPKTPPFNPFSCGGDRGMKISHSFRELDNFYTDFTNQWESDHNKAKKRNKMDIMTTEKEPMKDQDVYNGSFMKFAKQSSAKSRREERREDEKKKKRSFHESGREEESCSERMREEVSYLVKQKLKELELMDVSNVDHVLDIEEVLHYYSRLTCPAYLDIVDKFFMEMYSEFFLPQVSACNNNSQRFQSVNS